MRILTIVSGSRRMLCDKCVGENEGVSMVKEKKSKIFFDFEEHISKIWKIKSPSNSIPYFKHM